MENLDLDLNSLVVRAFETSNKIKELEALKKQLNAQLIEAFKAENIKTLKVDDVKATISERNMTSYDDDIVKYLKKYAPECVKEVADKEMIKAALKVDKLKASTIGKYEKVTTIDVVTFKKG